MWYYEKKKVMLVKIRKVKRKYKGNYVGETEYEQRLIYVPKQFDDTTDEVVLITKEKAKELGIDV